MYCSIAPVAIDTDDNAVVSAEEAVEVPPIVPLDLNIPLITHINTILEHKDRRKNIKDEESNDRRELFRKIGQQEFEDVVFTPKRKQRKSHSKTVSENERVMSLSATDHSFSSSNADNTNTNEAMTTTHSSLLSLSIDDNCVLKSDRDLESIQRDVENKEKLLANILDFDSILSKYMKSSQIENDDSNVPNRMDAITYINCNVYPNDAMNEEQSSNEKKEYTDQQSDHTETESGEKDVSYHTELKRLEDLGECRKALLQNQLNDTPSAGNSFVDFRQEQSVDRHELEVQFNGT